MTSHKLFIILLDVVGAILFLIWSVQTFKAFLSAESKTDFFTLKRFRYPLIVLFLFCLPILLVNVFELDVRFSSWNGQVTKLQILWISVCISFLISLIWMIYVYKLDIFEKESIFTILSTFVISALFAEFICVPMYRLVSDMGITLNGNLTNDFFYCVFVIGGIEETTKLLPLLILLKWNNKHVNEPYDYILYASVSALGFAFAENIIYINRDLGNINARMFYSTVAHMTFSSTIAYGLLLAKYRLTKFHKIPVLFFFFGIAIFSHGFYDFWLINYVASQFSFLTVGWFIVSVHIWYTMKNNAINVSTFFDHEAELRNDKLRHFLVTSMIAVLTVSYVIIAFVYGRGAANDYIKSSIFYYGYFVYYLSMGFSRFNVIKGYFLKFQIGFDIIIPKLIKKKE